MSEPVTAVIVKKKTSGQQVDILISKNQVLQYGTAQRQLDTHG